MTYSLKIKPLIVTFIGRLAKQNQIIEKQRKFKEIKRRHNYFYYKITLLHKYKYKYKED